MEHPTVFEVRQSRWGRLSLGNAKSSNGKVTQKEEDTRTNKESRKVLVRRVQLEEKDSRTNKSRVSLIPGTRGKQVDWKQA